MVSEPQYEAAPAYSKGTIQITQMPADSEMIQHAIETVI